MNYLKYAEKVLKDGDYRLTKPRLKVLNILNNSNFPLSIYEVSKKTKGICPSTVYRILEIFEKLDLVHFLKDKRSYISCKNWSCNNQNHCHHHFICEKCTIVQELHICENSIVNNVKKSLNNFKINSHYIEFVGLCPNCIK